MDTAFHRTLRRLESGGIWRSLGMAVLGAVALAAWFSWAVMAHVTLYEISSNARLEVDRAVHSIESPVAGRVIESRLALGQEVTAGGVLLRLNGDTEQYSLREENEKLAALEPELAALRAQAAALEQARQQEIGAAHAAIQETRERAREAEVSAQFAEQELSRLDRLHTQ